MPTYLIHFNQPYKHAQHYLGCTSNLEQRLEAHRAGRGSRLMEVVMAAGINFTVARIWAEGDFAFEKLLKHQKHHSRLCPICHPDSANRRAVLTGDQPHA